MKTCKNISFEAKFVIKNMNEFLDTFAYMEPQNPVWNTDILGPDGFFINIYYKKVSTRLVSQRTK